MVLDEVWIRMNLKLRDIMGKAFENVWKTSQERKVSLRMAAYILAVLKVAEATKIRGLYP